MRFSPGRFPQPHRCDGYPLLRFPNHLTRRRGSINAERINDLAGFSVRSQSPCSPSCPKLAALTASIEKGIVSATISLDHALFSIISSPASYNSVHRCVIYAGIDSDRGLTIKYFVTSADMEPLMLDGSRREIFTVDGITRRMSIVAKLPSI